MIEPAEILSEEAGRSGAAVVNLPNSDYPNTLERIVRVLRDAMIAIAALLISVLILTAINLVGDVSERLNNIEAPEPVTTECVGEVC